MNSDNRDFSVPDAAVNMQNYAREQMQKDKKKGLGFAVGLIIIIFAFIGIALTGVNIYNYFTERNSLKTQEELSPYNEYLIPVAAVDPTPFDDVGTAKAEELIEIAVWGIIGSNLDPEDYVYTDKELLIPAEEIEASFRYYFGNNVAITHCSVTGYGYEFAYNAEENTYYIPLTAVEPLYTPYVTEVEAKGDTEIITLGLINSGAWKQDSETGDFSRPEPDKYIKITLIHSGNTKYISAVRSSSIPETAIVDIFTEQSATPEAEQTTEQTDTQTSAEAEQST